MKKFAGGLAALSAVLLAIQPVYAQEEAAGGAPGWIAVAIGAIMAFAVLAGTTAQGRAISSGLDSIGRNPSASGKIQTPMIVGLAFIESLVIIGFVVSFLLLGKL